MRRSAPAAAAMLAAVAIAATCARAADSPADLSLEDLLKTEVSTVSRKAQRQFDAAAAVYVLTGDEILRSGATSLPDALRQVPGLDVAQLSSGRWAVSARGFTGRFANKLLVMLDGRSIYSPLYAGVLWEQEDVPLEDIDRIEVIRGAGAAVWGSNAVNGVINIITKKARSTLGNEVALAASTRRDGSGYVRHGGEIGDSTQYRIWASQSEHKPSYSVAGTDDGSTGRYGGFRLDSALSGGGRVTVSGEVHDVRSGDQWWQPDLSQVPTPIASPPFFALPTYTRSVQAFDVLSGANLLGHYEGRIAGGEGEILAYYEHQRLLAPFLIEDVRDTVDLDAQSRYILGTHDVILGAGIRDSRDDLLPRASAMTVVPQHGNERLLSLFAHDEWTLVPDRFRLTGGVRLEKTTGDRTSAQPNLRFAFTPDTDRTVWGAVAHAERIPARAEETISFPVGVFQPNTQSNPGPLPVSANAHAPADGDLANEVMDSAELGYRARITSDLSVDVAAFSNRYRDLRAGPASVMDCLFLTGFAPCANASLANPPLLVRANWQTANTGVAYTHGIELSADWHPLDWWRLQFNYGYLRMHTFDTASGSPLTEEGGSPRHNVGLRSSLNFGRHVQFDTRLRYVSEIPASGVPGYTELDARLAWRVRRDVELSLVGQNLLHPRHLEAVSDYLPSVPLQISRIAFVKARFDF